MDFTFATAATVALALSRNPRISESAKPAPEVEITDEFFAEELGGGEVETDEEDVEEWP